MIDHNVMRLDVAVHDAFAVAEVQCFEQLVDVVAHVVILEFGVERSEVDVVHVFEYETGCLGLAVSDDIEESHDVGTAGQVLQDLDLSLDLLLLDGLEHFDDAFLVVDDIDALKDLGVLSATCVRTISIMCFRPAGETCGRLLPIFLTTS